MRPLLLDDLHEDHVELVGKQALRAIGLLDRRASNDQIDDERFDAVALTRERERSGARVIEGGSIGRTGDTIGARVIVGPSGRGASRRGRGERREKRREWAREEVMGHGASRVGVRGRGR